MRQVMAELSWRVHWRAPLFHRFAEALADLAEAERLGVNSDRSAAVQATIFQASGRYDEALAIRQHLTQARPDIRALGAEAAVRAERGEINAAERLFVQARQQYRDVSPFPVVWLYFQQGLMWMWEENLSGHGWRSRPRVPGCQDMRRRRGTSP